MKTISQHLQQAFNALEFTNAGNLTKLNSMLAATEAQAPAADAAQRETSTDAGTIATAN